MDVKEAVKTAKTYVADLFADEGLSNLGLEEIEYDDSDDVWKVTIGFSRPWDPLGASTPFLGIRSGEQRTYKVVRVRGSDGEVVSVKHRDTRN